jgi:hypothetical protein
LSAEYVFHGRPVSQSRYVLLELLLRFGLGLLGELLCGDQLPVALHLLIHVVGLAELLLDRLELLAEQVLALRLVELALDLRRDLALNLEERDLVLEELVHGPQALLEVHRLQDLLRLFRLKGEVGRNQIREARPVLERRGDQHDLRGDRLAELDNLLEVGPHGAQEGLQLEIAGGRGGLLEARDARAQEWLLLHEVLDSRACQPLDEDPDAVVGQLDHPHDPRHGPHLVEVLRGGVLLVGVLLGKQQEEPVLRQRLVHRRDRPVPADRQRHHHEWEHHRVLERHRRQDVGYRDGLLARLCWSLVSLAHVSSSVTAIV